MPTAAPPTPPEKPDDQPQQSAADRLLRAQAAELEALRAQVQNLPDADTLSSWRSKAERFDALAADLPQWREQLSAAHQQEREALRQQLEQRDSDLSRQQLQSQIQTAFLQAGGNPLHFGAWMELYGSKFVKPGENGLVSVENGQTVDLPELLNRQRNDALYGVLFHPQYGGGSGARSGRDVRVVNTADLSGKSTSQLFRENFGSRRA
jgi:hypothetical protein